MSRRPGFRSPPRGGRRVRPGAARTTPGCRPGRVRRRTRMVCRRGTLTDRILRADAATPRRASPSTLPGHDARNRQVRHVTAPPDARRIAGVHPAHHGADSRRPRLVGRVSRWRGGGRRQGLASEPAGALRVPGAARRYGAGRGVPDVVRPSTGSRGDRRSGTRIGRADHRRRCPATPRRAAGRADGGAIAGEHPAGLGAVPLRRGAWRTARWPCVPAR